MCSAQSMFLQKGTEQTKMEDIAAEAGICKATLYTYYPNKTAVLNDVALDGMKYLSEIIAENTNPKYSPHDNFFHLCHAMTRFREKSPIGFETILQNINVNEEQMEADPVLREKYDIGERIRWDTIRN